MSCKRMQKNFIYRFIFFLFLIACSRQNSLRSTFLWKGATASRFPPFHPAQKSSKIAFSNKQQQAKSNLSTGMCTFLPQHALGKITPYLPNVHLFASAKCTFSPQRATSKITPFLRNVRFFAARFFDQCAFFSRSTIQQNHTFPSECALFRRQILR